MNFFNRSATKMDFKKLVARPMYVQWKPTRNYGRQKSNITYPQEKAALSIVHQSYTKNQYLTC